MLKSKTHTIIFHFRKIPLAGIFLLFLFYSTYSAYGIDTLKLDRKFEYYKQATHIRTDSAHLLLNELIDQTNNTKYQKRLCTYYLAKGRLYMNYGKDSLAIIYFHKADSLNSTLKNIELGVTRHNDMANLYLSKTNFRLSGEHVKKSLSLLNQVKDSILIVKTLTTTGTLYSDLFYYSSETERQNFFDTSLFYFDQALNIAKEIRSDEFISANLINLGILYFDADEHSKAVNYYKDALRICISENDSMGMADLYVNMAAIYLDQQKHTEAIINYQKARGIYSTYDYHNGINTTGFLLAEAYAAKGDYQQAYTYFESAHLLYDSLVTRERENRINELLLTHESETSKLVIQDQNKQIALAHEREKLQQITIVSLALFSALVLLIALFRIRLTQQRNRLAEQEISRLLQEGELNTYASMLAGQDKERERIAADLHDRLGALLATVKTYFQSFESKLERMEEQSQHQYTKANELLNQAVEEVRDISHDLSSGVLKKFGLVAALKNLQESIQLGGKLNIQLYLHGDGKLMSAEREIEIYRIVQELFSNTLRHAHASQVVLQVNFSEQGINLNFEDNGKGFEPDLVKKGMGLKNISARATRLNAKMQLDARQGRGTIVILDIPYL